VGSRKNVSSQPWADEQRECTRHQVTLPGKLFVPAEGTTLECQILNLSGGGAGVHCDEPPPLHTFVVLYIDGFGRFGSVATRYISGELGLHFVCKESQRQLLLDDLLAFLNNGVKPSSRMRRHRRGPSRLSGYLIRPNGDRINYCVLDISLQGASLKTVLRLPIGELINLGSAYGRVVRHHDEGIAIQFLESANRNSNVE
jgi:PilZ domain